MKKSPLLYVTPTYLEDQDCGACDGSGLGEDADGNEIPCPFCHHPDGDYLDLRYASLDY